MIHSTEGYSLCGNESPQAVGNMTYLKAIGKMDNEKGEDYSNTVRQINYAPYKSLEWHHSFQALASVSHTAGLQHYGARVMWSRWNLRALKDRLKGQRWRGLSDSRRQQGFQLFFEECATGGPTRRLPGMFQTTEWTLMEFASKDFWCYQILYTVHILGYIGAIIYKY